MPAPANRKKIYDQLEKGRHIKTHPNNASDQISNQSDIHKLRNLKPKGGGIKII